MNDIKDNFQLNDVAQETLSFLKADNLFKQITSMYPNFFRIKNKIKSITTN